MTNTTKAVNETKATVTALVSNTVKPALYTAENLLNGSCGNALLAITLQTLNYATGLSIASHPSLKMPSKLDTPDALRELLVTNPEFERKAITPLDTWVSLNIATCALIRDLAEFQEINQSGQLVRPYSWIADRARTPTSAITSNYDWRAEQSAKTALAQARLMNLTPEQANAVQQLATNRTNADNRERLAYALAEVNSVTHTSLLKAESSELVNMIIDQDLILFDIMLMTKASALRDVERSKTRLLAGQFTLIDEEVLLFANS